MRWFFVAIKPIFVVNENAFDVNHGVENVESKSMDAMLLSRLCTSGAPHLILTMNNSRNTQPITHAHTFSKYIYTYTFILCLPERIEFFGITKID